MRNMKENRGITGCPQDRVENTLAGCSHQAEWKKYKLDHSHSSLLGVKRMLQKPEEVVVIAWVKFDRAESHLPATFL